MKLYSFIGSVLFISVSLFSSAYTVAAPTKAGSKTPAKPAPPKPASKPAPPKPQPLAEARRGFQTTLVREVSGEDAPAEPPVDKFQLVHYDAPAGKLAAYISNPPKDETKKHPAIIWVFGGFDNDIGDTAWKAAPKLNDQSARAFWEASIVTMYPSFRGGNDNPGKIESFYGEVDDLLAAADYLSREKYVDPKRIYLGGHSTGGTLVLLAAAVAPAGKFRAVLSFGPVDDISGYGPDSVHFDIDEEREVKLRSPIHWINSIRTRTVVIEGAKEPSNKESIQPMVDKLKNPLIEVDFSDKDDHFSVLGAFTPALAQQILKDTGPKVKIGFTQAPS